MHGGATCFQRPGRMGLAAVTVTNSGHRVDYLAGHRSRLCGPIAAWLQTFGSQFRGCLMVDYDMVVIGSGPSGRRAAIQFAKLNKSVLVVEKGRRVGGVSVHTGTIPSKTLRETVLNLSGWRERGFYGRSYRVKQDIGAVDLIARLQKTLDHEVEVLEHQFSRNMVKTACGEGRFVGPNQIEVTAEGGETRVVSAAHVLIACGTRPFRPDYVPFDAKTVFDSDEIIDLPKLPRSLAVIGAGVIGVEYASIFSALDVAVTLIEPRPTFLDFIDKELIDEFMHDLRDRNVSLRLGSAVTSIEHGASGAIQTKLADGRVVTTEMLLFAAGRVGATDRLNLGAAGIKVDHRGRIAVDPLTLQTCVPHIYAAGGILPLRHLFGAGDFDHGAHGRRGTDPRHSL